MIKMIKKILGLPLFWILGIIVIVILGFNLLGCAKEGTSGDLVNLKEYEIKEIISMPSEGGGMTVVALKGVHVNREYRLDLPTSPCVPLRFLFHRYGDGSVHYNPMPFDHQGDYECAQ